MSNTGGCRKKRHPKTYNVAVLELVERKLRRSLYERIMLPNFTSVMPQAVAVWLEEMGHRVTYQIYMGEKDPAQALPATMDILIISAATYTALLAYSISNFFRRRGVITILGGPHARAYPRDAARFFDYVLGLTDRRLLEDLLTDINPNPKGGVCLSATKHPATLPGLKQRWRFIRPILKQAPPFMRSVPLLGSVGCPYRCEFCVDAAIAYRPLPSAQLQKDLKFLGRLTRPPAVIWCDPNFGVRFDTYMELIESSLPPGRVIHAAESSLSLLSRNHLRRLRANNFKALFPGVESWFAFGKKSGRPKLAGAAKVRAVARHFRLICRYIPYVQANFIFGFDFDHGTLPFQLTKQFVDLAPAVYPNFSLLTLFGDSNPLSRRLHLQKRVIDLPLHFLDNGTALNYKLKNYSLVTFLNHMIDLTRYSFSARNTWRRFRANRHPLPRWIFTLRAMTAERTTITQLEALRQNLLLKSEFQTFFEGPGKIPPPYFRKCLHKDLGPLYHQLPQAVTHYLQHGEPEPNPRLDLPGKAPA